MSITALGDVQACQVGERDLLSRHIPKLSVRSRMYLVSLN
jgi:hypothetical protein